MDASTKMWIWVFMATFAFGLAVTTEDIGPDTCGKDRTKLSNW